MSIQKLVWVDPPPRHPKLLGVPFSHNHARAMNAGMGHLWQSRRCTHCRCATGQHEKNSRSNFGPATPEDDTYGRGGCGEGGGGTTSPARSRRVRPPRRPARGGAPAPSAGWPCGAAARTPPAAHSPPPAKRGQAPPVAGEVNGGGSEPRGGLFGFQWDLWANRSSSHRRKRATGREKKTRGFGCAATGATKKPDGISQRQNKQIKLTFPPKIEI